MSRCIRSLVLSRKRRFLASFTQSKIYLLFFFTSRPIPSNLLSFETPLTACQPLLRPTNTPVYYTCGRYSCLPAVSPTPNTQLPTPLQHELLYFLSKRIWILQKLGFLSRVTSKTFFRRLSFLTPRAWILIGRNEVAPLNGAWLVTCGLVRGSRTWVFSFT